MVSKNFFSLQSIPSKKNTPNGSLTVVTGKEVPGFVNISYANLNLKPKGSVEPMWHPNAHKIGYCVQGKALVVIRSPKNVEEFTIDAGEIFFIPQGYIHHIENSGHEDCIIHFGMNHTSPETMYLSKALYSLSDTVFTSTFAGSQSSFLEKLKSVKNDDGIKKLSQNGQGPNPIGSRYKFNIEGSGKPILTKGGYVQVGTKSNLPILEGLSLLGFGLEKKGIVEPHWHTNAGELVFIVKGKTKITVLAPDGTLDVMEVNAGEGAFAAASHFHNIENIGSEEVEVIAFFSHADPDFIGIGEALGAFSNDVLSAAFNVNSDFFDTFNKPSGPLVIVPI